MDECDKNNVALTNVAGIWQTVINYFRTKINTELISLNETLKGSAKSHANYLLSNFLKDVGTNFDLPSEQNTLLDGYTADTPILRAKKLGYTGNDVKEFYFVPTNPINDCLTLLGQYFHRKGLLDSSFSDFSYVEDIKNKKKIGILSLGINKKKINREITVFPCNIENVFLSIFDETPFPLKKHNLRAGFPIQIITSGKMKIKQVDLFTENSEKIDGYNKFYIAKKEVTDKYMGFIPGDYLKPNTQYKVEIHYEQGKKSETASYTFKTFEGIEYFHNIFMQETSYLSPKKSKPDETEKSEEKNNENESDSSEGASSDETTDNQE